MSAMKRHDSLLQLMDRLGHRFAEPALLETSLTHRSHANEVRRADVCDNERLEFLGDAVIDLYVSERLYEAMPDWPEGQLSQARASLVNQDALAAVATELGLGPLLRLGRGEAKTGGRSKPKILCGTMEAVIGAVYIDGGAACCTPVLDTLFADRLRRLHGDVRVQRDAKTALQEILAAASNELPGYRALAVTGPSHRPIHTVAVVHGGAILAIGPGRKIQLAEQRAAAAALVHLQRMAEDRP